MTYVIDYKKKLIKKFNRKELLNFLNDEYEKSQLMFFNKKEEAEDLIKYAMRIKG
jgi:hypothetical protein